MKKLLLGSVVSLILVGCSSVEESPVEVEIFEQYNPLLMSNQKFLNITSLVDSVTIEDIIPNKGKTNCRVGGVLDRGKVNLTRTLGYGEVYKYIPLSSCDRILEIEVQTDKGSWEFTF